MATRILAVGTLVCLVGILTISTTASANDDQYEWCGEEPGSGECYCSDGSADCQCRCKRCHGALAHHNGLCQKCLGAMADCEGCYKRCISYQNKNDLFYNYYEGPNPSGTAAQMYVSPLPVPAHVGHTYVTYQPLMPHEFMYKHCRSHYAHTPGAGWSRAKIRYHTYGLRLQDICHIWSNKY